MGAFKVQSIAWLVGIAVLPIAVSPAVAQADPNPAQLDDLQANAAIALTQEQPQASTLSIISATPPEMVQSALPEVAVEAPLAEKPVTPAATTAPATPAVSEPKIKAVSAEVPYPGSAPTDAVALLGEAAAPQTVRFSPLDETLTAQATQNPDTTVVPGRATRSGSSYFGVGGNFGIGDGDTAVGSTSFALYSKIGLTRSISVRPSLLIRSNVTVLLPVTYDFAFGEGPTADLSFRAAPFVGLGPAITTGGGGSVDLLLTGGIDIPISRQFTATAAVNATVTGNPAVGFFFGVAYNFAGF